MANGSADQDILEVLQAPAAVQPATVQIVIDNANITFGAGLEVQNVTLRQDRFTIGVSRMLMLEFTHNNTTAYLQFSNETSGSVLRLDGQRSVLDNFLHDRYDGIERFVYAEQASNRGPLESNPHESWVTAKLHEVFPEPDTIEVFWHSTAAKSEALIDFYDEHGAKDHRQLIAEWFKDMNPDSFRMHEAICVVVCFPPPVLHADIVSELARIVPALNADHILLATPEECLDYTQLSLRGLKDAVRMVMQALMDKFDPNPEKQLLGNALYVSNGQYQRLVKSDILNENKVQEIVHTALAPAANSFKLLKFSGDALVLDQIKEAIPVVTHKGIKCDSCGEMPYHGTVKIHACLKAENYCMECLGQAVLENKTWPLRCRYCDELIRLIFVTRSVSEENLQRCARAAFEQYVLRDSRLVYCQRSGCGQLIRLPAPLPKFMPKRPLGWGKPVFCPGCFDEICLICKDSHEGMSCAQSKQVWEQELGAKRKAPEDLGEEVKSCPGCGERVRREGLSGHVRCVVCKTKWCFVCEFVVPTGRTWSEEAVSHAEHHSLMDLEQQGTADRDAMSTL